ncbi:MAG: transglutaminase-like cysteine peptidase [Alphaproteobacteria bacterium]|nr:transglutaminase-like cysteine peptidase [Alphaproteobacteria bacterium]
MRVGVICAFAASLLFAGLNSASAEPLTSSYHGQRVSAFMRSFGEAQPPYGFVRFCESQPDYCRSHWRGGARFEATPARLSQLDQVNRSVNEAVEPITDYEAYGVEEFWTLPTTAGDCEDYALLKRERLIALGWPESALLLTVVRDEQGDGHAVLTARTAHGDFVLDNKISDVRIWNATPYQFVMRQSYVNPKAWVSLEESVLNRPVTMAGSAARR